MFSTARLLRGLSRNVPLLAVALVTTSALPAGASPAGDAMYKRYHEAIHTAVLCEGRTFELGQSDAMGATSGDEKQHMLPFWSLKNETGAEAAYDRMEAKILQLAGRNAVTGNRLRMIDDAKADSRKLVFQKGCKSDEAQGLLAQFHDDLEPALHKG